MASVEVVLFDNDGTLVDTYDAITGSMQHAMNTVLGHALTAEEIASYVGLPLIRQMETFADDPSQVDELVTTYRAHNEADLAERINTFAGLEEALVTLVEQGYRLGVVSSKRQAVVMAGLEQFGLARYFEIVNGVEQSAGMKPGPEPLLDAARMMGVDPEACLYVGDSPYDIQAAHAAGMKSIGVGWGKFFSTATLAADHPTVLISDPVELVSAVGFAVR